MNTYMFNPTNDKYYAMVLMRMDARAYTLSNYTYAMLKVVIGFLPLALWVGTMQGAPLWVCLLIPLFVAGAKLIAAWLFLLRYARTGEAINENLPPKIAWPLAGVLLLAAYGLPLLGIVDVYKRQAEGLFPRHEKQNADVDQYHRPTQPAFTR